MEIKGLILDNENKIKYFMVQYHYNFIVHNTKEMIKHVELFKFDGIKIKEGRLIITKRFPKFKIEGLEKVESIMNTLEHNTELTKRLAGIDERDVELHIDPSDKEISVIKSFRDDEFFTEYDYEEDGYGSAQFIGWETIPDIVSPYLKEVKKERITCGGGDKLWFSVDVNCCEIAKLVPLS